MTVSQTLSSYVADAAPAVGTLLVAVVTWLFAQAAAWVRAHTKNTLVLGFMDRLSEEVDKGVRAIEQTIVTQLKDAAADGSLTAEDAAHVKQAAVDLVYANLGGSKWEAEAKKILGERDVKAFLASRIEAAVLALSAPKPAAVAVANVNTVAPPA